MTVKNVPAHQEPDRHEEGPGYQPRTLVLLGAGYAHLHVLRALAARPWIGVQVLLVAPHPRQLYSGMVPGFVAGRYTLEDCVIPLEPLARRGGVRWLQRSVKALDAARQTLQLDDGSTLQYDWLSVNTGPIQNRDAIDQAIPGAREHGLFVRPMEAFGVLWPQVREMAATRPLRLAVVGGGAAGIELALAARHSLPRAAVTLLTGPTPAGATYSLPVQRRLLAALQQRHITVLQDSAVGLSAEAVRLGCGASLACDVPLIATGAQPPLWLAGSGLALDAQGFLAVDPQLRSTSHPQVFAAGDVSARTDRALARSGAHAMRAGPTLTHNLGAATAGRPLQAHLPSAPSVSLLSCGDGSALAAWRGFSVEGRWVWWLKNRMDRRFIARYRHATPA